jgi:hypothetical protein
MYHSVPNAPALDELPPELQAYLQCSTIFEFRYFGDLDAHQGYVL